MKGAYFRELTASVGGDLACTLIKPQRYLVMPRKGRRSPLYSMTEKWMMSESRPSLFIAPLPLPCIVVDANKGQKWGGGKLPGNKAK